MALTCAHVVRDHLGLGGTTPAERPTGKVTLTFGALRREVGACVAECGWFPDRTGGELEDMAVLLLDDPLDEIPHPGLAPVDPPDRAPCYAYGSLAAYTGVGQTAWAMIARNLNDRGWHQLDADATRGGYFLKRGFSGAPVLDPLGTTIWGMVVEVDKGAEEERRLVAFAHPADALRDAHNAVKRCARLAGRPAPGLSIRADGPLDPLARETVVAIGVAPDGATVQASGLGEASTAVEPAISEDLLDAVRAMATAGVDPGTRDLASAGLHGLQLGNTEPAERFFKARIAEVLPPPPAESHIALSTGWLARLRGNLARLAGTILKPGHTLALPTPPSQREDASTLAAENRRLGAVLALRDVRRGLAAYEAAARLEPHDTWTWIEVCRLARSAGDLERAASAATRALAAARAAGDERDSMAALNELGDIRVSQGGLTAAKLAFQSARDVAAELAAADPGNAGWRRDLSVSWNKLGDVRRDQGDLAGALQAYEDGRVIAAELAASDPGNAGWRRDLSVSLERVAFIREEKGDRAGAHTAWDEALAVSGPLADAFPDSVDLRTTPVIQLAGLARTLDPTSPAAVDEARRLYERALGLLQPLAEAGRLDAQRRGWIKWLEEERATSGGP